MQSTSDTVTPSNHSPTASVTGEPVTPINPNEKHRLQTQQQIRQVAIAAILLLFSVSGHLNFFDKSGIGILNNVWIHWGLATLTLAGPARPILVESWQGLQRNANNINTPICLGVLAVYTLSLVALLSPNLGWQCFFDEPVTLLSVILLWRTLEQHTRSQAILALQSLVALKPLMALRSVSIVLNSLLLGHTYWFVASESLASIQENLLLRNPSSIKKLTPIEQENLQLVVDYLWGWMIGDIDQILSVVSPKAVFHEQSVPSVKGHDELRIFAQQFQSTIGNLKYEIDQFVVRGNQVAHCGTVSGIFLNQCMGVPAPGKSFCVAYAEFLTIENGQITYVWAVPDGQNLLQQVNL